MQTVTVNFKIGPLRYNKDHSYQSKALFFLNYPILINLQIAVLSDSD